MTRASLSAAESALREIERLAGGTRVKRVRFRLLRWVAAPLVVLAAPFLVLVRVAVTLHLERTVPTWAAVSVGAVLATAVLYLYAWATARWVGFSAGGWAFRLCAGVVAAYCIWGLLYVSTDHVKRDDIRSTYTSLHPLLRLGVSTLVLIDESAVITDTGRTPADYETMGLPVNERSLHFRQADGYVHAVDLRTRGRPSWTNALVEGYFRLVGFNTLRHVGTADHLHISLP